MSFFDIDKSDFAKILAGGGLFAVGFYLGRKRASAKPKNFKDVVAKSFYSEQSDNTVLNYCLEHSTPMHPVQKKLIRETLHHKWVIMMGAPEVVNVNAAIIKMLRAKKVLDIGVFTGASSLAAALALPQDGVVVACDVSEDFTKLARNYWREAGVEHKVRLVINSAVNTLDTLIANGEENTFDFAFIDANKTGYDAYYERCLRLLRPGGVIAFDNTLWNGKVLDETCNDTDTLALKNLNEKLVRDTSRAYVVQLNIGDGLTLAVKL